MITLRAALRPLRTELLGVGGLVLLLLLAAAGVALRLLLFQLPQACLDPASIDPACAGRQFDAAQYQSFAGDWVTAVASWAAFVPALAGVILGIAVVAKELDQRTAVLAWSVGPSRRRWLLQRTIPLLGVLVLLGIGCAQLTVALLRLRSPSSDIPVDFASIPFLDFGPAALAVSSFGLTVVVGAMLGRLLPSLLAAGAFVLFGTLLISQGSERLMAGESLVVESSRAVDGRIIDALLRTPDGRIIGWGEAFPEFADPNTGGPRPGVTEMTRYVPFEIYPVVAARYALLHLAVGLAALTLTFMVVERRSP
jgi:hypothetical protein